MNNNKTLGLVLTLVLILLIPGCAVSYRTIRPESYNYPTSETSAGVKFSYKYDVFKSSGNRRYAEKEMNEGLRLIAVQISNQSDTSIRLSRDFDLYSGDVRILPLEASVISNRMKQKVWPYYFYMLLTFVNLNYTVTTPTVVKTGTWPIGYVLGPGITLLNVSKASNSNRNLFINLNANDIWNRNILRGETIYGLIGLEGRDIVPIHIKKK